MSTSRCFHFTLPGAASALNVIALPPTTMASSRADTSWLQRPCTESNVNRCAAVSLPPLTSLMWTNSTSRQPHAARRASRPMRPNPLMPMRMVMAASSCQGFRARTNALITAPSSVSSAAATSSPQHDEEDAISDASSFV